MSEGSLVDPSQFEVIKCKQHQSDAETLVRVPFWYCFLLDEKMAVFLTSYTYADCSREHVSFVLIVKLNYGNMTTCMLSRRINYRYLSFV